MARYDVLKLPRFHGVGVVRGVFDAPHGLGCGLVYRLDASAEFGATQTTVTRIPEVHAPVAEFRLVVHDRTITAMKSR